MNSGPPALEDLGQLTMAAQAHPAEAADLNLQHKEDMRLLQALAEYNYRALDAVPDPSATIMHARDEAHQWLAQLRDGQPSFLYSQRIGVQDKSAQARERADSGVLRERTDSGTQSAGLSRQRALRRHRKDCDCFINVLRQLCAHCAHLVLSGAPVDTAATRRLATPTPAAEEATTNEGRRDSLSQSCAHDGRFYREHLAVGHTLSRSRPFRRSTSVPNLEKTAASPCHSTTNPTNLNSTSHGARVGAERAGIHDDEAEMFGSESLFEYLDLVAAPDDGSADELGAEIQIIEQAWRAAEQCLSGDAASMVTTLKPPDPQQHRRRGRNKAAGEGVFPRSGWGSSFKEWEIPHEQLQYEKKIGSGSFGTVYKGQWHGPVAIKRLNVVAEPDEDQLEAFRNEVVMLRKTRHTNVLLFMGACTTLPNLAIVTRWCDGLSLYQHLHVDQTPFHNVQLIDMGRQVAQGMEYLHAKNIIHRDLKSHNILLSETEEGSAFPKGIAHVHIADFGLATVKQNWVAGSTAGPAGSVMWMAPEIVTMQPADNPYTTYSDSFAFGITLYEMFSSQLPYLGHAVEAIMYMVGRGLLLPDFDKCRSDTPARAIWLIRQCLQRLPTARPGFPDIVREFEDLARKTPVLKRSGSDTALDLRKPRKNDTKSEISWTPRPLSIRRNMPANLRVKASETSPRSAPVDGPVQPFSYQPHRPNPAVRLNPTVRLNGLLQAQEDFV